MMNRQTGSSWEDIRFVPQERPYPNRLFVLCI